ncbi:MAG: fasciclin domain-containing protein, partial [Actinomycetota bacterium]
MKETDMKNKALIRIVAMLFAGVLVLAACGDDGDESSTSQSGESTESTEAPAEEEEAAEEMDIVDTAVEAGDFSTLVAAVQAADLEETLRGDGPFTVFAPTDEAFEAALADLGLTADELLADTELLTSVLTYHVVPGEVPAEDVVTLDGEEVETVNGATVTISVDGESVMVNDANVTATDVFASNGVIHVIDAVLLPPS